MKPPAFVKRLAVLFPLFVFLPIHALANAQVQSYAEMICGTNLNTAESEDPEKKRRCISGLVRLGRKSFQISGKSIQKCKDQADFFCLRAKPHLGCQPNYQGSTRACCRDPYDVSHSSPSQQSSPRETWSNHLRGSWAKVNYLVQSIQNLRLQGSQFVWLLQHP